MCLFNKFVQLWTLFCHMFSHIDGLCWKLVEQLFQNKTITWIYSVKFQPIVQSESSTRISHQQPDHMNAAQWTEAKAQHCCGVNLVCDAWTGTQWQQWPLPPSSLPGLASCISLHCVNIVGRDTLETMNSTDTSEIMNSEDHMRHRCDTI